MPRKRKTPRKLSIVRFDFEHVDSAYHCKYPFTEHGRYLYFGEVANMPGHCVVAEMKSGQLHIGYHTENFIELTDEEA